MTRSKTAVVVLSALALTACDSARREEYRAERAERAYQTAIADYTAGRIDAAVEGFQNAVRANPANASARFQLAVLLEETKRDYLGAVCSYRDFMLLEPSGDKARFAKERAANCEKYLARELASKLNLTDNSEIMKELDMALAAKDKAETANAKLESEIEKLRKELDAEKKLSAQRKALVDRMGAFGDEDDAPARPVPPRPVPAAESEDVRRKVAAAAEVPDAAEENLKVNPEALALNDADEEDDRKRSSVLPDQTSVDGAKTKLVDFGRTAGNSGPQSDPMAAARPKTYRVESGDTLYSIARRFYGRKSAWKLIREANKTTVSTDGKVRAGVELTLP